MNAPGYRPFDDEGQAKARKKERDSLFMQARIIASGLTEPLTVRVRNLSPGGMLAESKITLASGTAVVVELPNVGQVSGRVVWTETSKFGVAFDLAIDPQAVRRKIGKNAVPTTLTSLGKGLDQAPFRRR